MSHCRTVGHGSGVVGRAIALAGAVAVLCGWEAPASDLVDGHATADRFRRLNRDSKWSKVDAVALSFRTFHPQGMTIVGDRFFLSSVEVLDREAGRGVGHLFEANFQGKLLRQVRLGDGPMYHPGGIDFDGQRIWVPVAEYRPDSRSVVFGVDVKTLEADRVFEFADHLGALVCDPDGGWLVGVSWGSRQFYRWEIDPDGKTPVEPAAPIRSSNVSHYVDYQDGQFLKGTPWALFSGLSRLRTTGGTAVTLGGLELVDLRELRAVHQLPVMLQVAGGESLLRNPFAVEARGNGLRFYFVPEDNESTLQIYDVE